MGKQTLGTPSLHGSPRYLEPRSGFSRCQEPVLRWNPAEVDLLLRCLGIWCWTVGIRNWVLRLDGQIVVVHVHKNLVHQPAPPSAVLGALSTIQ